jgi:hypothetical protein
VTFLEALNSGRPMRRAGDDFWTHPNERVPHLWNYGAEPVAEEMRRCDWQRWTREDYNADDFEIAPEPEGRAAVDAVLARTVSK